MGGREAATTSKRRKKLSNLEVSEFIVATLAVANEQSEEGTKDLADFVMSRKSKGLQDLIEQNMENEDSICHPGTKKNFTY